MFIVLAYDFDQQSVVMKACHGKDDLAQFLCEHFGEPHNKTMHHSLHTPQSGFTISVLGGYCEEDVLTMMQRCDPLEGITFTCNGEKYITDADGKPNLVKD